jgi:hypothetical protein
MDLTGMAGRLISANEQLKAAAGVDLLGAVEGRLAGTAAGPRAKASPSAPAPPIRKG